MTSEIERFLSAVDVIFQHEGGYSNDPNDRGGPTKFGISQLFLHDNDMPCDADTILKLTKKEAAEIYKRCWWDKYHYNSIANLQLATKVFDLAVNMGPKTAHRIVQMAVNRACPKKNLACDGILGVTTVSALNSLDAADLMDQIRSGAAMYYEGLVADKPRLQCFLKGWLARADW